MAKYSIKQDYQYKGEDWWDWKAWIEATDIDLDQVEEVKWILHPTFPQPVRMTRDRLSRFELKTGGWGVFDLKARIVLKSGEEVRLSKEIELYYPDGTRNLA